MEKVLVIDGFRQEDIQTPILNTCSVTQVGTVEGCNDRCICTAGSISQDEYMSYDVAPTVVNSLEDLLVGTHREAVEGVGAYAPTG